MEILEILKSLGDLNRLRILNILRKFEKSCNCDLEEILELNQSNASRHLTKLRKDNLIVAEKNGKWSYYSMNSKTLEMYPFIKEILDSLEDEIYIKDSEKFSQFRDAKEHCLE